MENKLNDIAEKIKKFRKIKNMSQEELAEISGINISTIKKYECGLRNPKPDQLLKIANALGVSIHVFFSYEINTISDVISLLTKLDEQTDMKITGDKDEAGNLILDSIRISFADSRINNALSIYLAYKEKLQNLAAIRGTIDPEIDKQMDRLLTYDTIIRSKDHTTSQ